MRRSALPALPENRSRRVRRSLLRGVAAAGATLVTTALLPAVSSQAAPPQTVAEAQAQVDRLNQRAEVITEQYNGAQARLDQARRAATTATAAAQQARTAVAAARAKVSAFAAQSYEFGGMTQTLSAMLASGDPGQTLARMAVLQQVGQARGAVLTRAKAAAQNYKQAMATASQARALARAISAELGAQKQQVESLLAQSRQVLDRLTAEQRAQMLAAQRARAAAEEARAAAALRAETAQRAARDASRVPNPVVAAPQSSNGASIAARAVAAAMSKLGRPYVWAAAGPNSFDCSGLVQWAYRQVGVATAHYTGAFWNTYRHVSRSELRPGDLVFFYPDHHHVGIYIGGGKMINAPQTGDVVKVVPVASHSQYSGAVRVVG
jgi:cell wall-associated NlpC family hydrolase